MCFNANRKLLARMDFASIWPERGLRVCTDGKHILPSYIAFTVGIFAQICESTLLMIRSANC